MNITTRPVFSKIENRTVYIADGPDGHSDLLARDTADAAQRAGEEYFTKTRALVDGRWKIVA